MSWILSDEHSVDFEINSEALEKLLDVINDLLKAESAPLEELLEKVVAGAGLELDQKVDKTAQELADKFLDGEIAGGVGGLARLRKRLWTIEQGAEADRTFGWPSLKSELAKGGGDFSFNLNTEGGVGFEVLSGKNGDDSSQTNLRLVGSIQPKFSGKIGSSKGLVGVGADAVLERRVIYCGAYDSDIRVGRALGDAFSRLSGSLSDFDGILRSFNRPAPSPSQDEDGIIPMPLEEVIYSGKQGLSARLYGSAKVPIKAAVVEGSVKTSIEIGGDFEIKVRRKNAETLIIEATGGSEAERSFELGLGASVGISALSPDFATNALNEVKDVTGLFDKVDGVFEDIDESWLKPGSAIKSELAELLGDKVRGDSAAAKALRRFLADVFGVGTETSADDLAQAGAEHLADLIDDSLAIFTVGDDETGAFAELLRSLSDSLITQVSSIAEVKRIEDAFTKILKNAQDHLSSKLEEAAGKLDAAAKDVIADIIGRDPENALQDLRAALGKSRNLLDKIAKALGENSLDALAIEIGWARSAEHRHDFSLVAEIAAPGAEFYTQLFKNSNSAIERLLESGNAIPGVVADPEKSWLLDILSRSSTSNWNISIFGGDIGAQSSRFGRLKVHKTMGGVGIVSDTSAEVEKSGFFSSEVRKFSFANLLTFGPVKDSAPKISIDLTHDDSNLKPREVTDFMRVFNEIGLIDPDTSVRVLNSVEAARARLGGNKLAATLEISLGVPGRRVPELLKRASERSEVGEIAARSLVTTQGSRKELDEQLGNLSKLSEKRKLSLRTLNLKIDLGSARSPQDYFEIVMQADAIAEIVGEESRSAFSRSADRTENRRLQESTRYWRNLAVARDGLQKAFDLMAEAQGLLEEFSEDPGRNDEDRQNRIYKDLFGRQKQIIKSLKPWLKPGWGGRDDRPPERAAELFFALREIADIAMKAPPPIIVGFHPKGGTKKLFIGDLSSISND